MRSRLRSLDPRWLWLSQRGLLVLSFVVVAAAAVTVTLLRAQAGNDVRAALLTTQLAGAINRLSSLEARAGEDSAARAGMAGDELARSSQSTEATIDDLEDVAGESSALPLAREYVAAVTTELDLLASGQVEEALELERGRIDPLYERLEPELNSLASRRQESALAANQRANIVAIVAIIVTVVAVGVLLWKLQRTREAGRAAKRERDHFRQLDAIKDSLVATVSHELRTPLTSIMGYTELLLEEPAGAVSPDQQRFLQTIARNSQRLLRLVEDLLLLSRIEAGMLELRRSAVDLATVVRDVADAHQAQARRAGVALTAELEHVTVSGEASRLSQVTDNLIGNALKFTPRGGRVSVTLKPEREEAVLRVQDDGIGISPDEQAHLFDRFYRARHAEEQAIQGTGLGLSIVKAIVDAHGGRITIDSKPGAGTTFAVRIPAQTETERAPQPGGGDRRETEPLPVNR